MNSKELDRASHDDRAADGKPLLSSQERYRLLVEQTLEYAMLTMDVNGLIETWNEGAERILNYKESEVVGKSGVLIFTPEDREAGGFETELRIARETGQANDERWHLRKDGSRFWGSGVVTALKNDGRLMGYAKVMRDNTNRKAAEEALRDSKARLALEVAALERMNLMTERVVAADEMQNALDEILNASVEVLGADFGMIQVLDSDSHTLEIVAHEGFERPFLDTFRAVDEDNAGGSSRALLSGRRVVIEDVTDDQVYKPYWQTAEEAGYRGVQATPLLNFQGEIIGMLSTYYRDALALSERDKRMLGLLGRHAAVLLQQLNVEKALEKRVQERTQQVRRLASDLVSAEQRERGRIAQTLHDDLQQQLYSTQMQLQLLQDNLGNESGGEVTISFLKEELSELEKTVAGSINLTRSMTVELSPPLAKGAGLQLTFEWLGEHMADTHGLHVIVEGDDSSGELAHNQHLLLFQIVRELLFNVVKHAGVNEAKINIKREEDGISMIVSDHGKGFDVAAAVVDEKGGFGLHSVDERLKLFGRGINIESSPGQGTRVTIFMPFIK